MEAIIKSYKIKNMTERNDLKKKLNLKSTDVFNQNK